ncbi:MAG: RimK family alpha-L-glutamate ligase [Planctomycetota bacterium]
MQITVLGSATSWYLNDLRRAAGDRHEIVRGSFETLTATVGQSPMRINDGNVALEKADAVIVRTMPAGSLEQVVFRMNAIARLAATGVPVVNSPRSLEVAIDKYLALAQLEAAGFRVPATVCCQEHHAAMDAFESLGGDVVVKPLFGSEGRGMMRVTDPDIARRVFGTLTQLNAVIYVQQFVPHDGKDIRLLVVGDEVFGMQRENERDWRTNVSRGGQGRPMKVTDDLAEQAHRAAQAVGATVCALDLLPAADGEFYALEVNAVPGWRALSRANDVDIAAKVLRVVETLANR